MTHLPALTVRAARTRVGRFLLRFAFALGLAVSGWYLYSSIPAVHWLGKSIYFEARDEGFKGWIAVANTKFNRRRDRRFPNTIADIVTDGTERGARCDFSWYCDGLPDTPKQWKNKAKLQGFYVLAGGLLLLDEGGLLPDTTKGAHSYQRVDLPDDCGWFGLLERMATVGNHAFYRDKKGSIGNVTSCAAKRSAGKKQSLGLPARAAVQQ